MLTKINLGINLGQYYYSSYLAHRDVSISAVGECIMSNVELADFLRTGQYKIESLSPAIPVQIPVINVEKIE